jgi:hypothetical protein
MEKLRTVVTEPSVDAELEAIYDSIERADEALRGFQAILAKAPQCGAKISEHVWFMGFEGKGIWKTLAVYYTFNDKYVWILRIVEIKRGV